MPAACGMVPPSLMAVLSECLREQEVQEPPELESATCWLAWSCTACKSRAGLWGAQPLLIRISFLPPTVCMILGKRLLPEAPSSSSLVGCGELN